MKYVSYFLFAAMLLFTWACGNRNQPADNSAVPAANPYEEEAAAKEEAEASMEKTSIRFTEKKHDFGSVKAGEKVTYRYECENTGSVDLLIRRVAASCGCTTPSYEKQPIKPGQKGYIEVAFNTKGYSGKQHKTVSVITNTDPERTVLSFDCDVIPAE